MPKSKKKTTKVKVSEPVAETLVKESNRLVPEPEQRAQYLGKADRMKAKLAAQEKVSIIIPIGQGEKPGQSREHVQINGYIVEYEGRPGLPKGIYISVAKQVAEAINNAYNIPQIVGQDLRVDRDGKTSDALN
jgi:hypothetical protein